jgi:hypothetical protein
MGLLNIGRQEGSQIIQLFGRGVRLQGKGFTLKRSAVLDGKHPAHLNLLETLNIFAVRANYMSQFREYLEKEGVETEGEVELPLFIRPNKSFLGKGLVVPRVPEDRHFATVEDILLEPDPAARVRVDMSLKVQALESGLGGITAVDAHAGGEWAIPVESLELVDWERAYLDLLEYKERKGLTNLVIRPDAPRRIIATAMPERLYSLTADESVIRPESFAGTALLQEAVVNIRLPRIHFDRHLYQPLLVEQEYKVTMTPRGLNKSELQFVRNLKDYWANEKNKSLAGVEVFLLRNLSRGTGIGFFEDRGFYPDFILWIMDGKKQHIVFVEPHGMRQADAYIHDDKARLHEELPKLAKAIGVRSKRKDITLDSYIISATPYEDLHKKYDSGTWDRAKFADAHILFPERCQEYDYLKRIFTDQLPRRSA